MTSARIYLSIVALLLCVCAVLITQLKYPIVLSACPTVTSQESNKSALLPAGASNKKKKKEKGPIFIHILGLEGTGHHFMKPMVKQSPIAREMGLKMLRNDMTELSFSMRQYLHQYCKEEPSPMELMGNRTRAVDIIQKIASKFQDGSKSLRSPYPENTPLYIPTLHGDDNSWPAAPGYCRFMHYPNLDLFYDICEEAGVQCAHVLQYRNPYATIKSTTKKRPFNRHVLEAIHLYTTMYSTIHYQLTRFADTTIGCVGILEPNSEQHQTEINAFGRFFGFTQTQWDQYMKHNYHDIKPVTLQDQEDIVPAHMERSMKSLLNAHELVLNQCRAQCEVNQCTTSGYGM